jgi:hypothetical protein
VRYNIGRRRWQLLSVFWLDGGGFVRGEQRDDFEPRRWSDVLIRFLGRGTSSYYLNDNSWNESEAWSRVAGLEVPKHERERGVLSGGLEVLAHA